MLSAVTGNKIFRTAVLATLLLVVRTQSSQADFTRSILQCDADGAHPDIRIAACTWNIQSGRFNGRNLAVAFTNRGNAYRRKGQLSKAIEDYSAAILLTSGDAVVFVNRGNAHYYKGKIDLAIKDYDEAIRLNPNLGKAFGNRGNVFRNRGELERAIKDYDKAIQLMPNNSQVFADRGLAYEKKGERGAALRDFKNAYARGFRHPLLLRKLRRSE